MPSIGRMFALFLALAACGGGGSSSQQQCERYDEATCWCFDDGSEREPIGVVDTCDPGSVEAAGPVTACCDDAEAGFCECNARGCYGDSTYCACGDSSIVSEPGEVAMTACFAASLDEHCCQDNRFGRCTCSFLECRSGEREVGSCQVDSGCSEGENLVDSCS